MSEQDGGPAFPCRDTSRYADAWHNGMNLRDYFAAKSMQSTISKCGLVQNQPGIDARGSVITEGELQDRYDAIARSAYEMADAMLLAREAK